MKNPNNKIISALTFSAEKAELRYNTISIHPLGMNMYIVCAIGEISIKEYTQEAIPFIFVLLIVLALITYGPQIVLFFPNSLNGPECLRGCHSYSNNTNNDIKLGTRIIESLFDFS